mmetsp:Transcript_37935/g.60074  ORF Transcript_37935/g.60074 Transcript_37935/m.60074 type:complete len:195 (+) Transcript_37935:57-641(+)
MLRYILRLLMFSLLGILHITAAASTIQPDSAAPELRASSSAQAFTCKYSKGCPTLAVEWGKITVTDPATNISRVYKDAKVWPGGARAWDWRETGTRHQPGTQLKDVEELLRPMPPASGHLEFLQVSDVAAADVVIVSRGMQLALQVAPDLRSTMDSTDADRPKWLELQTDLAVDRYNEFVASGKRVAAVLHSTC